MERFVNRFQNLLVATTLALNKGQTSSAISADKKCLTSMLSSLSDKRSQEKRARRFERYLKVIRLHQEGLIHREIAVQTGLSRSTVLTYLKTDAFPERQRHSTGAYGARRIKSNPARWDREFLNQTGKNINQSVNVIAKILRILMRG